jgi:hypothetical protein
VTGRPQRRLVLASAIAVVMTAAFLPGSGVGSSAAAVRGAQSRIPAGLADAIHARLGAGTIRSSWASRDYSEPPLLGLSVALSADGTTALVGAPDVDNGKGEAYLFHVADAGTWSSSDTPTAALTSTDGRVRKFFGQSVALSADGTTAFVGAPNAGSGFTGRVYVFHVSAEEAWTSSSAPTAKLTVANGSDGAYYGISLALSSDGTTVVAGAPFLAGAGGAYVYHVSSEDAWASTSTPTATLTNDGPNVWGTGLTVAMSGDGATALVDDEGVGADLYHVSAEDAWTSTAAPTAILQDPNLNPDSVSSDSLALSGDGSVALLGDPWAGETAEGAVSLFRASSGAASWTTTSTPTATLTRADGSSDDFFGADVAVSTDGTTALVSEPEFLGFRFSRAYIFHVSGEGAWASSSAPAATLTASRGWLKGFTLGLAADGATALLGAPGVRFGTGAADVFHVSDASSWDSSSTPTAILTNSALNRCVVPNLKGKTVRAAKSALKARSCRIGRVRRVHAKGKKGRVVSQSRKPGSRLAVGTKVAVKIKK